MITTYGMLSRTDWLRERDWNLVILDEAQAIKNSGTRQSRAVKELQAAARVAMTGTPVENRLSDLWSLFDFLNPGLLGGAKASPTSSSKWRPEPSYQPLRTLVGPYISAPAEDRQARDRRPARQDRDDGLLRPEPAAGGPLRAGCPRSGGEAGRGRRHPAARAGAGPADAAQTDLQPSGPAARQRRLRAEHERQVSAPGRTLRRAGRAPGKGAHFHAVPRDRRPAGPVSRGRVRPARPGAARRHRGRQAAATRRELSARRRAAVLRALAQGRRHRAEPDRGLAGDPLRSLVEPGRGKPGDRSGISHRTEAQCPGP